MSAVCKSCKNIPYEWRTTKHGVLEVWACEDCPAPDADASALDQVLGAVLYDDGSLQHWQRAREMLEAIVQTPWGKTLVSWMAYLASEGKAPSLANILEAMGPEQCNRVWVWWLHYLVDQSAYANAFDAALVNAVREYNRRREAAQGAA